MAVARLLHLRHDLFARLALDVHVRLRLELARGVPPLRQAAVDGADLVTDEIEAPDPS